MLNKKQILGICLAVPAILFSFFLSTLYVIGGLGIIFFPLFIIGVVLIIIGSIIKIKESIRERSLSNSNSGYANRKLLLSLILLASVAIYSSWQIYGIYTAYSGLSKSRKEAESAAAEARKRAEDGQINKNAPPTIYKLHQ